MMKVLFLSLYSFETLDDGYIAADLANELVKAGCNLTIVSPLKEVKAKSSVIQKEKDYTHYHIACGKIAKVNAVIKVLNLRKLDSLSVKYLSKHSSNFDLIITMISNCAFYQTVKKLKKKNPKIYVYNLVKDIFPQNAVDLGMMKKDGLIYKYFHYQEKKYYKISDCLGCISPKSVDYIIAHNSFLDSAKVEFNPNSIIPRKIELSDSKKNEIKEKYKIPNHKTLFLYGGNLGKPQGIEFLLDCIKDNEKRKNAFFFIVGSGTEYNLIANYIEENSINNSKILPFIPHSDFQKLTFASDVGFVFLNKNFTVPNYPSRILSYMEASLPIIFAVDQNCDAATIAQENNYGFAGINGDINQFNQNVEKLANDKELRKQMGKNAFDFLQKEYTAKRSVYVIFGHFKR